MHMWHHVTNHLITSNDKDSNSETNENYVSMTLGMLSMLAVGGAACNASLSVVQLG
jgi:hypothetical protein